MTDKATNAAQATPRLQYIDAMRGVAMLFIVFGHIVWSYGFDAQNGATPASFRVFTNFVELPMFFFISGFVLSRKSLIGNKLRGGGGFGPSLGN